MKRIGSLLLAVAMAVVMMGGCGGEEPQPTQKPTTTTLMIYMVGSDLEPKAGAGTADLQEIADSGIDLACNQVVVCAGGAPHWHNEQVDSESINILQLQEGGFTTVSTRESGSMGDSAQLLSFLNYCWENYPADQFALVLWDHGNGPVMGYGKDILYQNDALLLTEMKLALAASPFADENKLMWVGFDACLMASAELSCLLADHARYLVASQEIEPAFGWNYSFLAQLGKVETPKLLELLSQSYMDACAAYYGERNYDHYDVTLSVVDLSLAPELETAINGLFSAAEAEVEHYYDLLAMNRVQSRALGRATTGSEYDLVDLRDMTQRLLPQYPQQAQALLDVIDRMVVVNATSIEGSCGMSLYYPFYNKRYYQKDWKAVYSELGLFDSYQAYLAGFEENWLKEDTLGDMTQELQPEQTADHTYSVTLSPEQASTFGSAVYYVMERLDGDLYRVVYSSRDVQWEGNTLSAEYDGMAIYLCSDGVRFIPPLTAVDQVGRLYRYSGRMELNNRTHKPDGLTDEELPEEETTDWRYMLTLNSETGKVEMSGTAPYYETTAQELVQSGRIEEADMTAYGRMDLYYNVARYITRYDNGAIKPLSEWYKSDTLSGYNIILARGHHFEYASLEGGRYYLLFEITDTRSQSYCSELLPIQVADAPEQPEEPLEETQSKWEKGEEKVLLKAQDGVEVYLTTRDTENNGTKYFIEVENVSGAAVKLTAYDVVLNGAVVCPGTVSMTVEDYDFMYQEVRFGMLEGTEHVETLQILQFRIELEKARSGAILWPEQLLTVDMTDAPAVEFREGYQHCMDYDGPYMGAMAEKQVIYETEELRLTLMGIGEASQSRYSTTGCWIFAENLTDKTLNVDVSGLVINGYYFEVFGQTTLAAGMKEYIDVSFSEYTMRLLGMSGIHSLTFNVAASHGRLWWQNETQCHWCPVELTEAEPEQPVETGRLLWEEQGVRAYLYKSYKEFEGETVWYILLENTTDEDICVDAVDVCFDGKPVSSYGEFYVFNGEVGPGQRAVAEGWLSSDYEDSPPEEISFRFRVKSFDETKVLFIGDSIVALHTK